MKINNITQGPTLVRSPSLNPKAPSRRGNDWETRLTMLKGEILTHQLEIDRGGIHYIGLEHLFTTLSGLLLNIIDGIEKEDKSVWSTSLRILRWTPTNNQYALELAIILLAHENPFVRTYALGFLGKACGRLYKEGKIKACQEIVQNTVLPYLETLLTQILAPYQLLEIVKVLLGDWDANQVPNKMQQIGISNSKPSYVYFQETFEKIAEIGEKSKILFIKEKAIEALILLRETAPTSADRNSVNQVLMNLKDNYCRRYKEILENDPCFKNLLSRRLPELSTTPSDFINPSTLDSIFIKISYNKIENGATFRTLEISRGTSTTGISEGGYVISWEGQPGWVKFADLRANCPDEKNAIASEFFAFYLGSLINIPVPKVQIDKEKNLVVSFLAGTSPDYSLARLPAQGAKDKIKRIAEEKIFNLKDLKTLKEKAPELLEFIQEYPAGNTLEEENPYEFFFRAQQLFTNPEVLDSTRFLNWILGNDDATIMGYSDFLAYKNDNGKYTLYPIDFGASFRGLDPKRNPKDPFSRPPSYYTHIERFKLRLDFALNNSAFMKNISEALRKFAEIDEKVLVGMVAQFEGYLDPEQIRVMQYIFLEEQRYVKEKLPYVQNLLAKNRD